MKNAAIKDILKTMIKKLLALGLFFVFLFSFKFQVLANEEVNLYFFWGENCPHCAKEKVFLEELTERYPSLTVYSLEITENRGNGLLLQKTGEVLVADTRGIPFTVIGDQYLAGFLSEKTTGRQIETAIDNLLEKGDPDIVGRIVVQDQSVAGLSLENLEKLENPKTRPGSKNLFSPPETVRLPVFGNLKLKALSLPVLTIVLGFLDGFNPCAMWVLLFLISLLLGMKDKSKMWALGIAFIVTSAAVYFLFMAAWLNLFLFLGLIVWVRLLIGLVALAGGSCYLRDFWINKDGACKVIGREKREKWFERMRRITRQPNFVLAMLGIIVLAFAVNLVELICSAGLPAVYTKTLTLSQLPVWQYYAYLLLYIFIFLLDDLFIFIAAMLTLQAVGIQSKYARYSYLIGGVLMVLIGTVMIFKPGVLMLG